MISGFKKTFKHNNSISPTEHNYHCSNPSTRLQPFYEIEKDLSEPDGRIKGSFICEIHHPKLHKDSVFLVVPSFDLVEIYNYNATRIRRVIGDKLFGRFKPVIDMLLDPSDEDCTWFEVLQILANDLCEIAENQKGRLLPTRYWENIGEVCSTYAGFYDAERKAPMNLEDTDVFREPLTPDEIKELIRQLLDQDVPRDAIILFATNCLKI